MKSLLGNTRRPDISFYKSGRIDITARVAKLLDLHAGDVIDIALDDDEYLLYIKHKRGNIVGRHEAQCQTTNPACPQGNNLRAYSKRLASVVLHACHADSMARLPVGDTYHCDELGTTVATIIMRRNQ